MYKDELLKRMFSVCLISEFNRFCAVIREADACIETLKNTGREKNIGEQIKNLRNILELWRLEAVSKEVDYNEFKIMRATFVRLNSLREWDFNDVRIAARAVAFSSNAKNAVSFAQKALRQIEYYTAHELYFINKLFIHKEAAFALLRAKYRKKDDGMLQKDLKAAFLEHSEKAIELCRYNIVTTSKFATVISHRVSMYFDEGRADYYDETKAAQSLTLELKELEQLYNGYGKLILEKLQNKSLQPQPPEESQPPE